MVGLLLVVRNMSIYAYIDMLHKKEWQEMPLVFSILFQNNFWTQQLILWSPHGVVRCFYRLQLGLSAGNDNGMEGFLEVS